MMYNVDTEPGDYKINVNPACGAENMLMLVHLSRHL